jgi:hemolysin D
MSANASTWPLRHPARELLARYRAVLAAAWALRAELAGPSRLAHEAAFLPAALSLQETPVHPAPRRTLWVLMALLAAALAWAMLGPLDVVAVAPGRIVVGERTKIVQPLEAGVVRAIHVRDGDRVAAGQLLVELDPTQTGADRTSVQEQLRAARIELARTQALLAALQGQQALARPEAPHATPAPGPANPAGPATATGAAAATAASTLPARALPAIAALDEALRPTALAQAQAEWGDLMARLERLEAEAARRRAEQQTLAEATTKLQALLPMARQREADLLALAQQGYVSSHAGQDRTRERTELERDLATQQAREREAAAALAETERTRAATLAEARRGLADRQARARLELAQLQQQDTKTTQRVALTRLLAPVAGTVQQLAVHTPGGVVTTAQPLMVIVPEDDSGAATGSSTSSGVGLFAEVAIENKDIGFVRAGQAAELKVETFNFTRYGTLPATLKHVAADAVVDEKRGAYFPATVVVHRAVIDVDGRPVRLSPGMGVTVEIKTGRRRVIEYLLSPVQRQVGEGLREQ